MSLIVCFVRLKMLNLGKVEKSKSIISLIVE